MMKKLVTFLLALIMAAMLGGCAAEEERSSAVGVLADMTVAISEVARSHMVEEHDYVPRDSDAEIIKYDTLSSLLLALRANDIGYIGTNVETAAFILAQNDDLIAIDPTDGSQQTAYSMMTMDDREDVYNLLNNAIIELKADGTIDKITEEFLKVDGKKMPEPMELPVIEGAETIVVAVTGDMPPLDYLTSDGKAAGFNVALLSAISEKAGINIELLNVESGARMVALSSGKADAIFWACSTICAEHAHILAQEVFEGALITESYASIDGMVLTLKK